MDKIILSKQSLDRSALLPHKASFPFLILYVMEKMYFCLKNGPCFLQWKHDYSFKRAFFFKKINKADIPQVS